MPIVSFRLRIFKVTPGIILERVFHRVDHEMLLGIGPKSRSIGSKAVARWWSFDLGAGYNAFMGMTKAILLKEVKELDEPLAIRVLDYVRGLRDGVTLEEEAESAATRLAERRLSREKPIPYSGVRKKLSLA